MLPTPHISDTPLHSCPFHMRGGMQLNEAICFEIVKALVENKIITLEQEPLSPEMALLIINDFFIGFQS